MIVRIARTFGKRLQGKLEGKRAFARLCELFAGVPVGSTVFLDFAGVELLTGSWINAVFVPLFKWAGDESNDLFPVICHVPKQGIEEIELVAGWTQRCFLVADGPLPANRATLVGALDPGQRATLEALVKFKAATGASLERQLPGVGIRSTAWNNRLKDLYDQRLLRLERHGRQKIYSPVVEEIRFNGR